ncbi:motility associated factor glycosyltransferase family protein [Aliarcobacter cryaerophilus]|uniref:motility associated factor glycosyltransferase family protein n=1 Tax=Aliarcobacter cryaerophilus TaxID=28198 RepID=UPI0021B64C85|nr:6-hydroxymethylpterin diphosphokinase MptE-like protein [Aliarcobacter cryaerophilus]MCT7481221.1 DUF115 domain-containing protein [Aliarcobacter cryaerophilus]
MTEAQIQLQNALTTTFLANLVFLSEYDRDLYDRVDELSRMIENGTYEEKYHLEFIMEDGDFDIYDVVNDKYLYNRKPNKKNKELVNKVNFDEKQSIFDIQGYFTIKEQVELDFDNRFSLEKLNDLNMLSLKDAQDYTRFTNEYLDIRSRKFKRIDKFIFLGTLLGRHIPKIAEKIDASSYLVLERNLEIFRLSLFTVDYTILAKKSAVFSIMDNIEDEEKKIYKFLNSYRIDNYFLKISTTNININRYIDIVLNMLSILNPTAYDYNRRLYVHVNRTTKKLERNYNFLDFTKIKQDQNLFKNKPILYIAAGPSLDEKINWVKDNQDKFFIICIGRALKKLLDNNIRVDIVVTLDEQEFLSQTQFDDETILKMSKNTIVFASSITNDNLIKKFKGNNLYIFEVFNSLLPNNMAFNGFSIGEIAFEIILLLNPKEIYILGLDLALNQKTGASHSSEDTFSATKLNLNEVQDRSEFHLRGSLIKVKGNFKKEVFTTPLFYSSIKFMDDKIKQKHKNTKVYNLSSNGAKFSKIAAKKVNDIDLNIYNNYLPDLNLVNEFFKNNSYKELNSEAKLFINKEIKFLEDNFVNKLAISKKNMSFIDFLNDTQNLLEELSNNNYNNLYNILYSYCELYFPYLSYYFNNKKLKSENKKVLSIAQIFEKHTNQIIKDYIACLKRAID